MPANPTIWTYDWVPHGPRGHVRDLRLRWALEEAAIPYDVRSVRFEDRGPDHLARQPFAQVPFLEHGEIRLFESGACLLYLGDLSEALLPSATQDRYDAVQWLIAGLNSVEMVTVPWWFIGLSKKPENPLEGWMVQRFDRLEAVLATRDWLAAGRFTIADILMADALRIPGKLGALDSYPALRAYVARATARPAFAKAVADQMAHFASGDSLRGGG